MSETSSQSGHKGELRKKSFDPTTLIGGEIYGQTVTSTGNVNYCSTGTSNSYSLTSALKG